MLNKIKKKLYFIFKKKFLIYSYKIFDFFLLRNFWWNQLTLNFKITYFNSFVLDEKWFSINIFFNDCMNVFIELFCYFLQHLFMFCVVLRCA